jgi:hypothetical protein
LLVQSGNVGIQGHRNTHTIQYNLRKRFRGTPGTSRKRLAVGRGRRGGELRVRGSIAGETEEACRRTWRFKKWDNFVPYNILTNLQGNWGIFSI